MISFEFDLNEATKTQHEEKRTKDIVQSVRRACLKKTPSILLKVCGWPGGAPKNEEAQIRNLLKDISVLEIGPVFNLPAIYPGE